MKFIEERMPQRDNYPTEIAFARAMQKWAIARMNDHPDNPLVDVCINDWFAEELILEGLL